MAELMQTDEAPSNGAADTAAAEQAAVAAAAGASVADALKAIVALLERSVKLKDTRLLHGRLLRLTASVRKRVTPAALKAFVATYLAAEPHSRAFLEEALSKVSTSAMQEEEVPAAASTSAADAGADAAAPAAAAAAPIPEVEFYAYLLTTLLLVDSKDYAQAKAVTTHALERLSTYNRRTLDVIASRIFFYYSLVHEATGSLASIRSTLLGLHRTAVLRHDSVGQETLMNLLLRNYLHYNLYDQAEKFRSKAQKSDQFRSSTQLCRYLYYLGRIRTIQLEYSDAKECLTQASRKGPVHARGFRAAVSKWLILVQLLLGEIPDRQEFAVLPAGTTAAGGSGGLGALLQPYLQLTQAVRAGDLVAFAEVAQRHGATFRADGTHNLVTRLHHNVLRTGLRRINLAYSRISLQDVAAKLHLASAEDAECIVAKAIRDGGIDAVIDHEGGFLASRETRDVYATSEPQGAFHARIAFCLDLHNEAVKAMRFEPDAHKRKVESDKERKERLEQAINIDLDDDEDDF